MTVQTYSFFFLFLSCNLYKRNFLENSLICFSLSLSLSFSFHTRRCISLPLSLSHSLFLSLSLFQPLTQSISLNLKSIAIYLSVYQSIHWFTSIYQYPFCLSLFFSQFTTKPFSVSLFLSLYCYLYLHTNTCCVHPK